MNKSPQVHNETNFIETKTRSNSERIISLIERQDLFGEHVGINY